MCRYDPCIQADIGKKYTSQHGVAATARHFSHKLGYSVSETTASFLKKYFSKNEQLVRILMN